MSAGKPEPRRVTGWAAEDISLPVSTLTAVVRENEDAAFPISGDARRRSARSLLRIVSDRRHNLNMIARAGNK